MGVSNSLSETFGSACTKLVYPVRWTFGGRGNCVLLPVDVPPAEFSVTLAVAPSECCAGVPLEAGVEVAGGFEGVGALCVLSAGGGSPPPGCPEEPDGTMIVRQSESNVVLVFTCR